MGASPLKHLRLDAGLTQFVLAQRTGISQGRLSLIEREQVRPSDAEASKIAAALGVPAARLFSGRHAPEEVLNGAP